MVEAKRKQANSEICGMGNCKGKSVLFLRDKPLCEKHWGEYCDNKEVK